MPEHKAPSQAGQASPPPDVTPEWVAGDTRRLLLKAAAFLLGYPDERFWTLLPDLESALAEQGDAAPAADLRSIARTLHENDHAALETLYVRTFDFSDATALYLTAHEFGDNRQRGTALLELRHQLRAGGFEPGGTELPDYLPLLLEFVACAPPDMETVPLEARLAAVCARIEDQLASDHPYRPLFTALRTLLPTPAQPRPKEVNRDGSDTGVMPYPIQYDT
jgi:nitrate reductase delta subunit